MDDWIISIGWILINWMIPFVLGLLFRKKVGHFLIKSKKWIVNDIIDMDVLIVRQYPKVLIKDISLIVFENIKIRIPGIKLNEIFSDELIVSIPIFGKLKLRIEKITDEHIGNEDIDLGEIIQITLVPETSLRLGVREIHQLNNFIKYTQILFDSVAASSFENNPIITKEFAVCNLPRISRFIEEKLIDIDDPTLGAKIHGTKEQLSITISPISEIVEATKKYLFI